MTTRKKAEFLFDLFYLVAILGCAAFHFSCGAGGCAQWLFGVMALVLSAGDLFHLAPRMYILAGGTVHGGALAFGKWLTSITSAVYYLLLYYVWRLYVPAAPPALTALAWLLTAARIVLCCLPQNQWQPGKEPRFWSLWRNLPFLSAGVLLIVLYMLLDSGAAGGALRLVPLAIALSFSCYLPVVLFAARRPAIGLLMMPKTLCYLWIQVMGLAACGLLPTAV